MSLPYKRTSTDPPYIVYSLPIRFFPNRRRINGPSKYEETSVVQGKASNLPLPVFVTNANSSLPSRRPATQSLPPDVRTSIRRRTLTRSATCRPAEDQAYRIVEFSSYGILEYQTQYPFLMNREPEPEKRPYFQPAAGDSEYKPKL